MDNPNNREKRLPPGSGFVIAFMVSLVFWICVIAWAFPIRGLL